MTDDVDRVGRLAELEAKAGTEATEAAEIAVEWGDAEPEERPDGMAWDATEGRIRYDFWGAQWDALDALEGDGADLVGFVAGYRSGKSIMGARWVLTNAIRYPGTRHLVMGQDFQKAHGATYRVLFEQLPGERTGMVTSGYNGPEQSPIVADYNRTRHTVTLTNDSVIVLGAGDRWARHAGDEYATIHADEVAHYKENVHDLLEMLGSRLTSDAGPNRMIWTTTGAGLNDVWEILEEQVDEDGEPLGLNIELIRGSVLDNPYLDDGTRERLRRQYEGTGREEQALHGGFTKATGLVYKNFSRETHVVTHEEAMALIDDGDRYFAYGYDAGWRDPRVVVCAGKSAYGQLVIFDEFYREESHAEDAIQWLESTGKPNGTIFCEHVPAEIDKLKAAGWHALKASKDLDSGIAEVRHRLEVDDDGRPGLLVSERCTETISEFLNYEAETVGTSKARDHCMDSTRYLVMGEATVGEPSIGVAFG